MSYLADLYLLPPNAGRSVSFRTIPTGRLDFRGGHARLVDQRELPWVLARADINVVPTHTYFTFVPQWLNALPEHVKIEATITLPPGYHLGRSDKPKSWHLREGAAPRETCLGCDVPLVTPYKSDVRFCTLNCSKRYFAQREALADTQAIPDWRGQEQPDEAAVVAP